MSNGLFTLLVITALWSITYLPFAFAGHYGLIPAKMVPLIWMGASWLSLVCIGGYIVFRDRWRR
ncbi:hypothetical protein U91I_02754 [alpha proteobacterium U9-1i]|nr:hypothetical protein U91I_02754 [alpha proteobacterium U9-1i]